MSNISRRDFLKGTLAGTAAVVVNGALGATAAFADEQHAAVEAAAPAAAAVSAVLPWTELNPQDESYTKNTTDYSAIFSPIQIGNVTLKNRIIKTAAGSDTMVRGESSVSQNTIDYYGRFADGGAALVLLEGSILQAVGLSPDKFGVIPYEQSLVEIRKIIDRIHQGGALAGVQMNMGYVPSKILEMTTEEVEQVIENFRVFAAYLKEAGFDVIELKAATIDTSSKLCSRYTNKRDDKYGAKTEEDRVRFFCEMVAAVRETVGPGYPLLAHMNAMEENDKTIGDNYNFETIEEGQYLAKALVEAGADFIEARISTGGLEANCWAPDAAFSTYKAAGTSGYGAQFDYSRHYEGLYDGAHDGCGAFIPMVRELKKAVDVPVGCAGYIDPRTAPDMMNDAIANGDMDLLFINRPLTVDPELPKKLQEGRWDEVAPCTRCFHCHASGASIGSTGAIRDDEVAVPPSPSFPIVMGVERCRVNATTQCAYTEEFPEGYDLTPAASPKNVMVIGGGVGGMEAARIAAERGHKVTLYEKNGYMGGMLLFAQAIKGDHEHLMDLRNYLVRQQEVKGVTVVTGQAVDVDFVKEQNPDAVIVAVGGKRESRFSGANVISIDDIASAKIGDNVVILGANAQATDVAQYLLAQGKNIQIVHEGDKNDVDKEQSPWIRYFARSHMYSHGVRVWNESTVDAIEADGVHITMNQSGHTKVIPCDTVIEAYDMIPNTELMDEISAAGFTVYAAGCDAPKNIQSSIHDGYKVSRYLE